MSCSNPTVVARLGPPVARFSVCDDTATWAPSPGPPGTQAWPVRPMRASRRATGTHVWQRAPSLSSPSPCARLQDRVGLCWGHLNLAVQLHTQTSRQHLLARVLWCLSWNRLEQQFSNRCRACSRDPGGSWRWQGCLSCTVPRGGPCPLELGHKPHILLCVSPQYSGKEAGRDVTSSDCPSPKAPVHGP